MRNAIIVAFGLMDAILIILSQIALWQRKEYRIDRMRAYITSPEGALHKEYGVLLASMALLGSWLLFFQNLPYADEMATVGIFILFFDHAKRIRVKGIVRPDVTLRALLVAICVCTLSAIWISDFTNPETVVSLQVMTYLFFLPFLVACSVFIVSIPAIMQKRRAVHAAQEHRKKFSALRAVGITGSIGKTSTKKYLLHILGGESSEIVATAEHRNSSYVVAQDMVWKLTKFSKIYIAEMGAYVKGEIAQLCSLVQPSVGVITSITNQHVGLFGSLEKLASTKWELIDSLPHDGVAVLNKDDAVTKKKAEGLRGKVIWFSLREKADVYLRDISFFPDHITAILCVGAYESPVRVPAISRGQLQNAVAAAAAAHALQITPSRIREGLQTLPEISQTMEVRKNASGMIVIDDSYSASEGSIQNALEYIRSVSSPDIRLVLVPIIELGPEGARVHERIGTLLSQLSLQVYIYGDAYKEYIQQGLGPSPSARVEWFDDPKKIASAVKKQLTPDSLIVLEGRIPVLVKNAVL